MRLWDRYSMTDANPSILLYSQAIALIQKLSDQLQNGQLQNVDDISSSLKSLLTSYEAGVGKPLAKLDVLSLGEPPLSPKMNLFWDNITTDINILQDQLDTLRAASVYLYNIITSQILQAVYENDALDNKLKVLQLYSGGIDSKTFIFGDSFSNIQFIDSSFITGDNSTQIKDHFLILGQNGNLLDLTKTSNISILGTSNGFAGNNQEIEDPNFAPLDPITNLPQYIFVGQTNRAADLGAIIDGVPNTWFEYEHYYVNPQDKVTAGNFNFAYQLSSNDSTQASQVDWSLAPTNNTLELALQIDLKSIQSINLISYNPYGLENNSNLPVRINSISTSQDGTAWDTILQKPIWVGADANLAAAHTAADVSIGEVSWNFDQKQVQFIRLDIQQPNPIDVNIGHLYYLDTISNQRVQGPIPLVTDPLQYDSPVSSILSNMVVGKEYFRGKRWAIGIRDFSVQAIQYFLTSTMVTKPITVNGVVDRLALNASIYIPPSFANSTSWIQYYISGDDGISWVPISRIEDAATGISSIVAFNDPLPSQFQDPGVTYAKTASDVTALRFKIVLTSPTPHATPVVQNYKLTVKLR